MNLSKTEIELILRDWLIAWNKHDLNVVMELFHEDIIFENWTGSRVEGKKILKALWTPWFQHHGNFKFLEEDLFFDEQQQKLLFMWRLEWPSNKKTDKGKQEIRRGVDIIHFEDGKITQKNSYSKTTVHIEGIPVSFEK